MADGTFKWVYDRPKDKMHSKPVQNIQWGSGQPNGKHHQQCMCFFLDDYQEGMYDLECSDEICAACGLPDSQQFYLRGLREGLEYFDTEFSLILSFQKDPKLLVFDGNKNSKLIWYFDDNYAVLQSEVTDALKLTMKGNPIGRNNWTFESLTLPLIFTRVSAVVFE